MESRNKGKCLKNEKKEKRKKKGLYTFMIIIDQNSALLQDYARVEQYCEMLRRYRYWKFNVLQYVLEDGKLDWM